MDDYVEPHLSWRRLLPQDFKQIEDLREQLESLDNSVLASISAAAIEGDPHVLAELAVGGWDDYDSLSAYGLVYLDETADLLKMYLIGGVHPTHRHQQVGSRLLAWQVEAATRWRAEHRPGKTLWLGCYAELGRPGLARIAQRQGFSPQRFHYDLHHELRDPIAQFAVPGIDVVAFTAQYSDATRTLHDVCFEATGAGPVAPQDWTQRLQQARFDWSTLALTPVGEVVGYAISSQDNTEDGQLLGWTERFGVHPKHRRKGVALALLAGCLRAMQRSGCAEAGIGIDTEHGAGIARLCGELGYKTRDAVALLSRSIP